MQERYDPYRGNILIEGLGPIPEPKDVLARLLRMPEIPPSVGNIPMHVRLHALTDLQNLHIPSLVDSQIFQTIDLMTKAGYRDRDPSKPTTWTTVAGQVVPPVSIRLPGKAATVVGHSGTGKTQGISRGLEFYPAQVIRHEIFPEVIGPHYQMVFLSVDVPASGRLADLARNIMVAWDQAMRKHVKDYVARFDSQTLNKTSGPAMMDEVRGVAVSHFLGVLHLDEVQNFFKLIALRNRKKNVSGENELAIVEEQCLREVLALINTWGIPVIFSGTPEGVGQLSRRFSNMQRFSSYGYHQIDRHCVSDNHDDFDKSEYGSFVHQLMRYQYVKKPLDCDYEVGRLMIELTGGIKRIMTALWFAAHRVAFSKNNDFLSPDHLKEAASMYLKPIQGAINALNSGKPEDVARFDDLINTCPEIWSSIWMPTY
jgi:hypothetical protein